MARSILHNKYVAWHVRYEEHQGQKGLHCAGTGDPAVEGIKQQKLPQALWNLDRIDKHGSALNGIYRYVTAMLCSSWCLGYKQTPHLGV